MPYLDYNATTPVDERVLEAMLPFLTSHFGNPSSPHSPGHKAREAVEEARERVARLLNAEPKEIIFTSGGSEANNFAIKGIALSNKEKGNHIITSQIEHPSVLNVCKQLERQGFEVTYLPVDRYGIVDLEALERAITPRTILITIMHANNEVGTIQPVEEIGRIAKEKGVIFHTDAVQTAGKLPLDMKRIGCDLLSLSGHKFYGPKGVGALYIRKRLKIEPLIKGGEQERDLRAGTENVPGIVGLGKASEIALEEMEAERERIKPLRDKLERELLERIPEIIVCGHPQRRLYNTLSICVKYVEGESILLNLDEEGVYVSTGSACSSASLEPSHVLLAMGIPPEIAHGSLRFSLGKFTTEEDIDKVVEVLPPIVEKLRRISPFWEGGK